MALRLAARGRLDLYLERLARSVDAGDLGGELERDALLLQQPMELPRDLAVDARQDVIEKFDDRDLRAEPPPYRAQLKPDNAAADDQKLLRHFGQVERAGRGHDALLVDVDAVKTRHVRAGGDDDILGLERLRLAGGVFDLDLAGRDDAAGAVECFDLVLLEQRMRRL